MLRLKFGKFFMLFTTTYCREMVASGAQVVASNGDWRVLRDRRQSVEQRRRAAACRLGAARMRLRKPVHPCRSRRAQPPARELVRRHHQTLGARVEQQCRSPFRSAATFVDTQTTQTKITNKVASVLFPGCSHSPTDFRRQ